MGRVFSILLIDYVIASNVSEEAASNLTTKKCFLRITMGGHDTKNDTDINNNVPYTKHNDSIQKPNNLKLNAYQQDHSLAIPDLNLC